MDTEEMQHLEELEQEGGFGEGSGKRRRKGQRGGEGSGAGGKRGRGRHGGRGGRRSSAGQVQQQGAAVAALGPTLTEGQEQQQQEVEPEEGDGAGAEETVEHGNEEAWEFEEYTLPDDFDPMVYLSHELMGLTLGSVGQPWKKVGPKVLLARWLELRATLTAEQVRGTCFVYCGTTQYTHYSIVVFKKKHG
jgi:hypothetical protein